MLDDRRRHPRVTVNLEVRWDSLAGSYEAKLEDISLSGCFINTTGQVEMNEPIKLEVLLASGEWLSLTGVVASHQPTIGFAIAFANLTEEQKEAISALCQ